MGSRLGTLGTDSSAADPASTPNPKTVAELMATQPHALPSEKNISPPNLKKNNALSPPKEEEGRQAQESDPEGREALLQGRKVRFGPAEGRKKAPKAPPLNRGYDDDEKIQE